MKYNVNFEHGILKIKSADDTVGTVLRFTWHDANTIAIKHERVTRCHTRCTFDATFIHYHAMLMLHDFIEMDEFFNGSVAKFIDFGKKIARSYSPEIREVERKLRKHIDTGNPDKVAVYLVKAFSTDDPNAEFASLWKANLPPVKAVFDCQSDIFRKAADYLKANGWKVVMIIHPEHGLQMWCLDQNGQGYHSSYDWSQDE